MPKNQFIQVPEFGHLLISGPLFDWLTEQRSNKVSLAWSPLRKDKSSLTTYPIQHLHWELILFSDQKKQSKEAWRLEPNGELPVQEALDYIEETF
jgi:hypothetical protein